MTLPMNMQMPVAPSWMVMLRPARLMSTPNCAMISPMKTAGATYGTIVQNGTIRIKNAIKNR